MTTSVQIGALIYAGLVVLLAGFTFFKGLRGWTKPTAQGGVIAFLAGLVWAVWAAFFIIIMVRPLTWAAHHLYDFGQFMLRL